MNKEQESQWFASLPYLEDIVQLPSVTSKSNNKIWYTAGGGGEWCFDAAKALGILLLEKGTFIKQKQPQHLSVYNTL